MRNKFIDYFFFFLSILLVPDIFFKFFSSSYCLGFRLLYAYTQDEEKFLLYLFLLFNSNLKYKMFLCSFKRTKRGISEKEKNKKNK